MKQPSDDKDYLEEIEEKPPLDKSDIPAMIIAGFLTVGVPCLLGILLIIAVVLLLF